MLLALFLPLALADGPSSFSCCDDPVVESVVKAWLDAGEALAAGKPHAAALEALAKAASGSATGADGDAMKRVEAEARELAALPLARAREQVPALAQEVVWLALRHESGSLDIVQATCAGQGSWIQRKGKKVKNPTGSPCGAFR